MPNSEQVEQIGWWCGIVSVFLIGVGFFAIDHGGDTDPGGPIGVLVNEVATTHGRIVVGNLVGVIGALLLIWFAAALRLRLASPAIAPHTHDRDHRFCRPTHPK